MSLSRPAEGDLTRQLLPSILLWTSDYVAIQPPRIPGALTVGRNKSRDDIPLCVRQRRQFITVRERRPVRAASARGQFRFPGSSDSLHEPPLLPETELAA